MAYLESNLKTELAAAFDNAGYVCWKYPDNARGLKKPCDLICGIKGQFVALETKLVKIGTASNKGRWHPGLIVVRYEDVRPNQHDALKKAVLRGNQGFVVTGIYDRYDHHRLAWALNYERFLEKPVWTFKDCYNEAIRIPWVRGWDVSELVDRIGTEIAC